MNRPNKNFEEELKRVKAEYESFTYIVSHDLSAPFRQIEGFAKLIEKRNEDNFDDKTKEYFNLILESTNNCKVMMAGLMEFSRIKVKEENIAEIDINKVLKEIEEELSEVINKKNASISYSNLNSIQGERKYIKKLFFNLIDNSLKFQNSDDKPQIEINSIQNNGSTEFIIKDNGIGIKSGFEDKVFEIFRKGGNGNKFEGNGLGLAVAKKIVEEHQGRIFIVDSTPSLLLKVVF